MKLYFRRIAELRIDNDKGQKEVAAYLNIDRVVYGRYERGDRDVPVWVVIKLAQYYNTTTDYILGLTDDPRPHA